MIYSAASQAYVRTGSAIAALPQPAPLLLDDRAAESVETLADRTYLTLRSQIITGRLRPGALIEESRAMADLGVGRTPLREAITRLEHDELVSVLARRGTFVSDVSVADLAHLSQIRAVLEPLGASLAAERAGEPEREQAEQLLAELAGALPADPQALILLDQRIHGFVYRACRNPFLEQDLLAHYHRSLRMWFLVLDRATRLGDAVTEHRDLLRAILDHDAATAGRLAGGHVVSFDRQLRGLF
ncbi:MAG TPA: GntR family transcriptional regulator [Gaiellales bacterium]|nr:GntR family transcriptional regulator [Gaiellales bacterium]